MTSNELWSMSLLQAGQIAVVAIVAGLLTLAATRRRPRLVHAVWLIVLLKCVTPPAWGHHWSIASLADTASNAVFSRTETSDFAPVVLSLQPAPPFAPDRFPVKQQTLSLIQHSQWNLRVPRQRGSSRTLEVRDAG